MYFNKKQGKFLAQTIEAWKTNGTITQETADKLKASYSIYNFDWQKLAKYSFLVAVICAGIALFTQLDNYEFINFVDNLMPHNTLFLIFFSVLSLITYLLAFYKRKVNPQNIFGNEAILLLGAVLTSAAISYLGFVLDNGSGHFSLLLLLGAFIYLSLGIMFPSKMLWVLGFLSLGAWFGTETGYQSGGGAYYLGMNYPLRFVFFGIFAIIISFIMRKNFRTSIVAKQTFIMGLLYLFIALWILSIFGNYGNINSWYHATRIELLKWVIFFALAAFGAIYYGLKTDNYAARAFGIVFLLINLYTRYFEYFWDKMNKAILFAILALSFWFVGCKAQKLINLRFSQKRK